MKRSFSKFLVRLDAIDLRSKIEKRALSFHVSLEDLYGGAGRASSISAARREIYSWLMQEGKSINEIARLFDRAPNGVWKLTKGKP